MNPINPPSIFYLQKSLQIRIKIFGKNNIDTACTYNNLGLAFLEYNKFDESLEHLTMGLKVRINLLGIDHIVTSTSYLNLGNLCLKINKKEEALITKQKKTTPNRGSFYIDIITIKSPTFKRMLTQIAVVIANIIGNFFS